MNKTLYDKIWDEHQIAVNSDDSSLLYIDRHLVHEVTSPQAFEGLKIDKRRIWNKDSIYAVSDHNVPTSDRNHGIEDKISKLQVDTLVQNCHENNITYFDLNDVNQGIVHVIGPELGITQPGMTLVCGDSHTSTHGALAALAFGIGTSDVEHVLATQCINVKKAKNMRINIKNKLREFVTPKDVILYVIKKIGTSGGTAHTIEFTGQCINDMSIEGRMTICNMSIEAGAKSGLVAFDDKTLNYVINRRHTPSKKYIDDAIKYWEALKSDDNAYFDLVHDFDASLIVPQVSWGTSPEMTVDVTGNTPDPSKIEDSKVQGPEFRKNDLEI